MGDDYPLSGMRVLELAWVVSAPMVGQYLADLGAEVIKVEHNDRLDMTRLRGRPEMDGVQPDSPTIEVSPIFSEVNRGKKSITLNFRTERGVELVKELVEQCDVLIENFTPGTLSSHGLSYDELSSVNPELVMLSMSPAGRYGPLASMRSYAPIISSLAGLESLVRYHDSEEPLGMLTFGIADPNAASHAIFALFAVLFKREQTGNGGHIDFSQYEAQMASLGGQIIESQLRDGSTTSANRRPVWCPYGAYPTRRDDEWITMAVRNPREWEGVVKVIDESWVREDRFSDLPSRKSHESELDEHLAAWTASRDRPVLVDAFQEAGVAATPVRRLNDSHTDTAFPDTNLVASVDHKYLGEFPVATVPWRFSNFDHHPQGPPPELGEHTDEVFCDLVGMDSDEIEQLRDEGVLY